MKVVFREVLQGLVVSFLFFLSKSVKKKSDTLGAWRRIRVSAHIRSITAIYLLKSLCILFI